MTKSFTKKTPNPFYKEKDPNKLMEKIKKYIISNKSPEKFDKEVLETLSKEKYEYDLLTKHNHFLNDIAITYGLENDNSITLSVPTEYQGLALQFKQKLIKDYNCTTHIEKSAIDMIVMAYCRTLLLNKKLNYTIDSDYYWREKKPHFLALSKELERANNQYQSAIINLQKLKNPNSGFNLTIKTKTAYMAQNQVVNQNTKPDKGKSLEKEIIAG